MPITYVSDVPITYTCIANQCDQSRMRQAITYNGKHPSLRPTYGKYLSLIHRQCPLHIFISVFGVKSVTHANRTSLLMGNVHCLYKVRQKPNDF
jgi:hypothetical protein